MIRNELIVHNLKHCFVLWCIGDNGDYGGGSDGVLAVCTSREAAEAAKRLLQG